MTCDGARDARIWGEAKTSIRNKADMTERLGPGSAGQPLTEFLDHFKMFKIKLDLAFNNVKPKDRYFVLD